MQIIYGDLEEYQQAHDQLRAWSVSTNTEILDAELEYLADARDQVGFNSRKPVTIGEIAAGGLKKISTLRKHLMSKLGGDK